jgi:aflatoxin B1 aldehyde reductase
VAEAALRWLTYHSKLAQAKKDGIIIGASKIEQLEQNIESTKKGQLSEKIAELFEDIWAKNKSESPDYFRYPKL